MRNEVIDNIMIDKTKYLVVDSVVIVCEKGEEPALIVKEKGVESVDCVCSEVDCSHCVGECWVGEAVVYVGDHHDETLDTACCKFV